MSNGNLPVSRDSIMPEKITPDEIFRRMDLVKKSVDEPPSGFLTQLINAPARERAAEIEKIKLAELTAKRKLIDGLSDSIQLYVDAHKGDLKVRTETFVSTTFAQLRGDLYRVSDSMVGTFYETYSDGYDRINKIPNLTEQEKKDIIHRSYERAVQAEKHAEATFISIVDEMAEQLRRFIREVGGR